MLTPGGFPGQRLRVLPAPLAAKALSEGVTSQLLVTDSGYFPHAVNHGRRRAHGAPEAIIILCIDGQGWCETGDPVVSVPAGTALVIPPGVPHLYRADNQYPWTIWWLHVTGHDVSYFLAALNIDADTQTVKVRDVFSAVAAFERVVESMERDETLPNLLTASGSAWSLLSQLTADYASSGRPPNEPIQLAMQYLREHFATDVCVPDLARMAGLSRSHFSTLFRNATGGGVVEYVKSLRMARARELLLSTSLRISEVGRAVGYSDAFYFSRQFHRVNGCSPSDYRSRTGDVRLESREATR